jgi:hypothetical protein
MRNRFVGTLPIHHPGDQKAGMKASATLKKEVKRFAVAAGCKDRLDLGQRGSRS